MLKDNWVILDMGLIEFFNIKFCKLTETFYISHHIMAGNRIVQPISVQPQCDKAS